MVTLLRSQVCMPTCHAAGLRASATGTERQACDTSVGQSTSVNEVLGLGRGSRPSATVQQSLCPLRVDRH